MTADRALVHMSAQLVALVSRLARDGPQQSDDVPRPRSWPNVTPAEAEEEWNNLRRWVDQLCRRYPSIVRLPECWWRHNDLVEVLAALRDFELASFHPTSPATAAVEWQRALRDMEVRLEIWIKRLPCSVPGRGHEQSSLDEPEAPPGWKEFVENDVRLRRKSPTSGPSDEGGGDVSSK